MDTMLQEYFAKYKPLIDAELEAELARRKEEVEKISPQLGEIVAAMQELAAGGKRLRGMLTIAGFELAGGVPNGETIKAAVAMELFHLGLLIHDDIMDRDSLRRGVTTIHARYKDLHLGESLAVCAGDYTFAWTSDILMELTLPSRTVLEGLAVWNKYFYRVGYGQTLDVWTDSRNEATEEEILSVLSLKSGEYTCVLPLLLGATLAGGSEDIKTKLHEYGMELGWAFQLRDDYLAEYGETEKTGKPVGNDSREGKKTIVTMYGKDKSEEMLHEHLLKGQEIMKNNPLLCAIIEYVGTREN
jgi:geranylgeranyl diphosphate synthase type I